ncbi:MAG: hypothetical protein V7K40_07540 [Nostoc sp.]|uniref:hypothetical protein n=1 Tax=Nostoc sp. TaxID=1180 RepID=UPI002FFC8D6D
MTTTVQELLEDFKYYTPDTEVVIKDVNDREFAIIRFQLESHTLTIVIGEKVEEESSAA